LQKRKKILFFLLDLPVELDDIDVLGIVPDQVLAKVVRLMMKPGSLIAALFALSSPSSYRPAHK